MVTFAHTYKQTYKIMVSNTSLRARIIGMEIGDTIVLPITDYVYTTIRSYASDLGFVLDRKYTSSRDRQTRTYSITRTA